jgi:hypothetical protein
VAQLGARLDGIEEARGSNPLGSTKLKNPNHTDKLRKVVRKQLADQANISLRSHLCQFRLNFTTCHREALLPNDQLGEYFCVPDDSDNCQKVIPAPTRSEARIAPAMPPECSFLKRSTRPLQII